MNPHNPRVSILVPVYNASHYGADYLEQLCESILAQTFGDFEVLIGDNGSTDHTAKLAEPYLRDPRFRLVSWKPNCGLQHGMMILLNVARGQYWCPSGVDDVLEPRFLERRVPLLAARPERNNNRETQAVIGELGYAAFAIIADGSFRMTAADFARSRGFKDFLLAPAEKIQPEVSYLALENLAVYL